MQDERSYRTQRRLLVLGMGLGYLGCLLVLWYIWNAPRQWWFDTFWLHIGANRFTLMLIPLIIFCACYFKLRCISGNMLKFRDRQLDERQRMVRDSAHRTAYKIVTLLCLLIPLYLAAQGLFGGKPATPTVSSPPVSGLHYITIKQSPIVFIDHMGIVRSEASPSLTIISPDTKLLTAAGKNVPVQIYWFWQPLRISQVQPPPATPAPAIVMPNPGIYYGLVLLTLLLIISTLPKAIVAWQER